MGILKLASSNTNRIWLEKDGEGDYIDVHEEISKGQFNKLVAALPQSVTSNTGMTPVESVEFQTFLFEFLVAGWSLSVEPNTENYLKLDRKAASVIDENLMSVFNDMTVGESDAKKPRGSRRT